MFCKLRHWSQRLLERGGQESVELRKESPRRIPRSRSVGCNPTTASAFVTSTATTTTSIPHEGRSDPRELPRPAKYGVIRSTKQQARKSLLKYCYTNQVYPENTGDQDDHYTTASACNCPNCRALPSLTECGVCLEPLQGRKVHSCPICANLTCRACASKLKNCAFCRTNIPSLPNAALERLLERLALPCKNSRSGCPELVEGDSRTDHEAVCSHGSFGCPVGSHICGWDGNLTQIEEHLKKVHELRAIVDNGIAVEISGFRGKAYANDGRQYTVCLSCYQNLYVVKIVLFQGKLRLSFSQIGTTSVTTGLARDPARSYGVWMKVGSASKHLEGALPFGKGNCETREVEISCDSIISRDDNDSGGSVKINIVIKPITVV